MTQGVLEGDSDTSSSSPFWKLHYTNPIVVAGSTSVLMLGGYKFWTRFIRRIPTADHLPEAKLVNRTVRGVVTSVGDADNFRLYHKPYLSLGKVPSARSALKDQTLHVRLAGVDAPELAHFGHPAQPFAAEALNWLTSTLQGRTVRVRLLRKDRYGRVGMAYYRKYPWPLRRNVSEEMLKAGLATVYTQGGAEHDGLLPRFQKLEQVARTKRLGMWSQPNLESPAEYKRRVGSPVK